MSEFKPREPYTNIDEIAGTVASCHKTFATGKTKSITWRRNQIKGVLRMMEECKEEVIQALHDDLKQLEFLAQLGPINRINETANRALNELSKWMSKDKRALPMVVFPARAYTFREPLGVSVIFGVWNFPLITVLCPLIGALAAGNCVILKPSEISDAGAAFLVKYIPQYLDRDAIKVVHGGIPQATELLKQNVDKIFYTGNGKVARIIMAAAAQHLTPVTLELGGKNPAIVHSSCDIKLSAKRITWGKFQNMGQACVAPDYVLVDNSIREEFTRLAVQNVREFFGEEKSFEQCKDLSRIVNSFHTERIGKLIDQEHGEILIGGRYNVENRYIDPTLIATDLSSPLMKDEIFGPVLLIIGVDSLEESVKIINDRDKPLALYMFATNQNVIDEALQSTSSGGVCINDTMMHAACLNIPFGGVGGSGMGNYHGKYTFDCFSHEKGVLHRSLYLDSALRYPPYSESKQKWVNLVMNFEIPWFGLVMTFVMLAGVLIKLFLFSN